MNAILVLSAGWLGLLAGGQHAVSGPDHFAGVAPLAARSGSRAWRVGVAWGLGHASGAALAAGIALAIRASVPGIEAQLSGVADRIVGVLMCVIGALGLRAAMRAGVHDHRHEHAGIVHSHPHARRSGADRARRHDHRHSTYVLGVFHGAGGLAHLFAVVPALGFPGVVAPAAYLAGYALASLALITAFAVGIGCVAPESKPVVQRGVLFVASTVSLGVGLAWVGVAR